MYPTKVSRFELLHRRAEWSSLARREEERAAARPDQERYAANREVRELALEFGFTAHIRSRDEEKKALAREAGFRARRCVVERTHSIVEKLDMNGLRVGHLPIEAQGTVSWATSVEWSSSRSSSSTCV